ncbi:hypothetical protein WMF33_47055 [Sorangium sp. So ce394]
MAEPLRVDLPPRVPELRVDEPPRGGLVEVNRLRRLRGAVDRRLEDLGRRGRGLGLQGGELGRELRLLALDRRDVLRPLLLDLRGERLPERPVLGLFPGALLRREPLPGLLLGRGAHGLDVDLALGQLVPQPRELRARRRARAAA